MSFFNTYLKYASTTIIIALSLTGMAQSVQETPSTSHEPGNLIIHAGGGIGFYSLESSYRDGYWIVPENATPTARLLRINPEYGVHDKASVGVLYQQGNFTTRRFLEANFNTFALRGAYYFKPKEAYNIYIGVSPGYSILKTTEPLANEMLRKSKFGGLYLGLGLGGHVYITPKIGLFVNASYATHAYSLLEMTENGLQRVLDDIEYHIDLVGPELTGGIAIKL